MCIADKMIRLLLLCLENECELSANVLIGWINKRNVQEDQNIKTLDHRKPELLSKTELQERRDFIEESLKLKENKILNSS